MSYIHKLFDDFDDDRDGVVDGTIFKRILNILELPIINIDNQKYNYTDLEKYIYDHSTMKKSIITVDDLKLKMSNQYDAKNVDFILQEIYKKNKINEKIDLVKMIERMEKEN